MNQASEALLLDALTERELEILPLLAEGLTNREIAQKLTLSLETIKWYNRQIYSKLDVGNRTEAGARARELGLFGQPGAALTAAPRPAVHNLPAQLSSFVGRQQQIAEVQRLLDAGRLVTLTGPGGVGKTRLGLEVAASVVETYADGVFFVSLSGAGNQSQVPKVIAHALGIGERPGQSPAAILRRYLQNQQTLLLLDNFEHVLGAVSLVTDLLAAAPELTVLVTSREALHLTGEHEYLVPPLTLPDPAQDPSAARLTAAESVTLFVQRARTVASGFRLSDENAAAIADICLRLDGLPLAIELAAARIRLFTPRLMRERLHDRLALLVGGPRDLPHRQRTLRATIDWSYHLLDDEEKLIFARLAVFRNGRSLAAIEAIAGSESDADPLAGLSSLLAKSLLYQEEGPAGEPRFYMLETIHEYAREKLAEIDREQETQDRHLAYFVSWAEEIEPRYLGPDQLALLAQTEAEMGNIRAAFKWAWAGGQIELAARLISAVDYYFRYKEGLVEGYQWFKQLSERVDEIPPPYNLRFLIGASRLAWYNHDFTQSKRYMQQAGTLIGSLEDDRLMAWYLVENYFDADDPEDVETGRRQIRAGLEMFGEQGYKPGMAYALNRLGEVARLQGNYDRARELYEEGLVIARETGETVRERMLRNNLSLVAYQMGAYQKAYDLLRALMKRPVVKSGPFQWAFGTLPALAGPLAHLGEAEKAARLLGAAVSHMEVFGVEYQPQDQPIMAQYLADVKSRLDEATFNDAFEEGKGMSVQEALAYGLAE